MPKNSHNSLQDELSNFTFGLMVASITLSYQYWFSPIQEDLFRFFNSNFFTTFAGAIAGAGTILFINKREEQNKALADINASIGTLTRVQGTLISIKGQYTLPLVQEYIKNENIFDSIGIKTSPPPSFDEEKIMLNIDMQTYNCPNLYFTIPTDRIFNLTHKVGEVSHIISQTKEAVSSIEPAFKAFEKQKEIISTLEEEIRVPHYLGKRYKKDKLDTSYVDTMGNLNILVDDALFFINKSIESLTKLGKNSLPPRLIKKIAYVECTDQKYTDLMPPEDHLDGWNYN